MKKFIFLLSATMLSLMANAQEGPTMGWSSWNTFALNISEDLIKEQADAMVNKKLSDVGYRYINIDDGYFGGRDAATGRLLIHPTRFPNGMKPVVDYIHSLGLKAGIYSDAGHNTCGNYYGGDKIAQGVGLYEHDDQDCQMFFNELGFDFIKVDFCGGDAPQNSERLSLDEQTRYTAISKAIRETGRDDVRLNVCRWNYPGTWVDDIAFSWRTTHDIANSWESVKGIIEENLYMAAYCRNGHFNDMDMLEVGRSLTEEEDRTHFGMWCMLNSPLLIGCDMRNIKTSALNLLRNTDLIAVNQDPLHQQAYLVGKSNDCYVLVRDVEELNSTHRVYCIYNPSEESKRVTVHFDDIDLGGNVTLRDLLQHRNLTAKTEKYTTSVPAHGIRIYRADAEQRLERRRYEAETGYIPSYQELRNNQTFVNGIYSYDTNCSGGLKAGWLGRSAENRLEWEHVWSREGGEYVLTLGYLCGEDRQVTVSVNGSPVKTITVNSGGWGTVGTVTLNIDLQAGDNVVALSNPTAWMPDIDYMTLESVVPTGIKPVQQPEARSETEEGLYDLSGRRLPLTQQSAKGLLIENGKKVYR
ncbi:MAG: alpha-galactosidase [Bacteroidales bacterium]|nr:alpha-galactosidase [Bacteroidales bacterium]